MARTSFADRLGAIIVSFAALAAAPALAVDFDQVKGRSVVAEIQERLTVGNGSFRQHWRERVYVSTSGRIFQDFDFRSDRNLGVRFQTVDGDETGAARRTPFRWSGNALVRQWRSTYNVIVRESIVFSGGGGALNCELRIERTGYRGQAQLESHSCRIVDGNVFGGGQS